VLSPRLAAVVSLVLLVASVVLAVVLGVQGLPRGLSVLACVVVAMVAAWWALVHRGAARVVGAAAAGVLLVGAVVLVVLEGWVLADALVLAGLVLSVAAASRAFALRAQLPAASPPRRPVLFFNPKSGGGKAEQFHVAREARARGVEPVELHLGDDLGKLVRDAIENDADSVGVAGGDGAQAIVAAIAAERGLPYVCVPAGTRNHFALDLGVDRDDVVGALDAFTKGREACTPKRSRAPVTATRSSERSPIGTYGARAGWRGTRPGVDWRRWPRAQDRRGGARLQRPLPARTCARVRHTPTPGRRNARHHSGRGRRRGRRSQAR